LDFTLAETTLRDAVTPAITELRQAGVEPAHVMLVGAVCRDVLHQAAGHTTTLRATGDLDLALAIDGWDRYKQITSQFEKIQTGTRIRYLVAGVPVDLVPFGDLENPDGTVEAPGANRPMNVLGYQDVWAAAAPVTLPTGAAIWVPTIPGFTLRKLAAWADRSKVGEYKDGSDLACAMFWYQNMDDIDALLYQEGPGLQLLERTEFDTPRACVLLLVGDTLSVLAPHRRQELRALWNPTGTHEDLLATYLINPKLEGWPRDDRLLGYADAVREALLADPVR
jgi:predicted nucleotidyltransferase